MMKMLLFLALLGLFVVAGCTIQKDIVEPIDEIGMECSDGKNVESGGSYDFVSSESECGDYLVKRDGSQFVGGCYTKTEQRPNTLLGICDSNQDCMVQIESRTCLLSGQKTQYELLCENAGGQLRVFGNGCVDSCGVKPRLCTQELKAGCDCGTTRCYDGQQCLADPYEPYATPQEACENTGGVWGSTTTVVCFV